MPPLPIIAADVGAPPRPSPTRAGAPPDARADVTDADLVPLLRAFYDALGDDPGLAPYFAPLDMAAHVPRIADFWSTMLWHTGRYAGNAFRPHLALEGLRAEHFGRWLDTLAATVDARHAGPDAERLKTIGHRIAFAMQLRLGIAPTHSDAAA